VSPVRPSPPLTPPIAAPSILSADFAQLAEALAIVDPARDWVHCDVMDNHFVPNLTFGPLIVSAVRKLTPAFLDVHLMIDRPERTIAEFRAAGADQITAHLEAPHDRDMAGALVAIRESGARAGLAIKPGTPFAAAEPHLGAIDLLLVMTVEPGFGGQEFMPEMLDKVRAARTWRERHGARFVIEVDGGIAPDTASRARAAGAEAFVAGHAVYGQPDPRKALEALRASIAGSPVGASAGGRNRSR
jgi:ribulose-phosphate 3-epimerase